VGSRRGQSRSLWRLLSGAGGLSAGFRWLRSVRRGWPNSTSAVSTAADTDSTSAATAANSAATACDGNRSARRQRAGDRQQPRRIGQRRWHQALWRRRRCRLSEPQCGDRIRERGARMGAAAKEMRDLGAQYYPEEAKSSRFIPELGVEIFKRGGLYY